MSTSASTATSERTSAVGQRLSLGKAINAGLRAAMEADPKVVVMGEDVGPLGGVFRVTEGLQKDFGDDRVIDTPLGESGIVGAAVGMMLRGYRPVVEIQFDGFVYPAYDQIVSQVAKLHARSQGVVRMPAVIRIPFGGGIGAVEHHSESPEAQFCLTAGLRVVSPSNAHDAYWMIQQAIASDDPVVFMEPKRRYWDAGPVGQESTPLHASQVVRDGRHATLLAYGPMVRTCLESAEAAAEDGVDLEVIDLRTLSPLDLGPVHESARSSCTRRRARSASAPRSPPACRRSASTPSRRRCCASPATTCPTRPVGWRRSSCPTSTVCSTPSTARWRSEGMS